MKPKVFKFSELVAGNEAYDKMRESIIKGRMVPVLGSGFSCGFKAKRGVVPTVKELKEKIAHILKTSDDYSDYEIDELVALGLSRLSDAFLQILTEQGDGKEIIAPDEFLSYMEECFYKVAGIPSYIRKFLKCEWDYIYTLNYDDAIEGILSDYEIIVPYRKLNEKWLRSKKCLIKLHGDVHALLSTKEMKYCILSKKQYFESIASPENKNLMEWLQDDYVSKDLLFIGCGLNNEYDFLFADDNRKTAKLSYDASDNSFYIYYDSHPETDISLEEWTSFRDYGIKNIIRVLPDEMPEFYNLISDLFKEKNNIRESDKLEKYRNFTFQKIDSCDLRINLPYVFENKALLANGNDNIILFPRFFIHRTVSSQIVDSFEQGISICILAGNRFSGKTYALLDIVNELQKRHRTVYYIHDKNIPNRMFSHILQCKQSVFVFDCGTVKNRQFQDFIVDNLKIIKENSIQIVYGVNRSDRNFGKVIHIEEDIKNDVKYCPISTVLNPNELKNFNSKIAELTIVERKDKDTFLDYALRIENAKLMDCRSILPAVDVINDSNMLKCILLLANCGFLNIDMANRFDITDELVLLCKRSEQAVQKDYLSDFELLNSTHSCVKYVSNSLYWLYRCLSTYAKDPANYVTIAETIVEIVKTYMELYRRPDGAVDYEVYQEIKPYYYLDTLQSMFFFDSISKGSITLPNIIYTQLRSILKDQYQFLHQTAKCKLRYSQQLGLGSEDGKYALEEANLIIDRAIELAQKSRNDNKQYTLTHMNVTKALILTNYLRYFKDISPEKQIEQLLIAIDCYNYFYVEFSDYSADLTDNELSDVKWFMEKLFTNPAPFRTLITDQEHRNKVERILNAYYGKRISISWV